MRLPATLLSGRHEPMGSLARDGGVNFAVFSEHAHRIELCVFDAAGTHEVRRYDLHGPRDGVFCGFLAGAGAGLVYGLRAHGPYDPHAGHRFNPHKCLLDPYAREIVGRFEWRPEHHGYAPGLPDGPRSLDTRDNGPVALKARVARPPAQAPGFRNAPRHAAANLVLYEIHVKGFSAAHPGIPEPIRGTYAALAHPESIAHLRSLGVTTLSLLPIHYHLDESALVMRGLTNHWGYNTLGFFCPDPRFASGGSDPGSVNEEFRRMVADLHDAGLEVVLDVVYNHTAESDEKGPTLSFRGLDNAVWYRLLPADQSRYENVTGCGNTVNVAHPRVTQFVLDSLRHWVEEMGVDGFRFDLAPVLGRTRHGFDPAAAFFTALRQDPVLARVHLIAEPWDAGHDGYQAGHFPGRFLEWNDKFRDAARRYWLSRGIDRGQFARRFTASRDLFHHAQRGPEASVNYVAVHDGFTLADLVTYSRKHNEANGEANRDGRDGEPAHNFGIEGPSDNPQVRAVRERVRRALIATALLAQGTPMICAGDEIGRTQRGNNNAYCHDDASTWLDWANADRTLLAFVSEVIALRRGEPLLRHDRWFHAPPVAPGECGLAWWTPAGHEMNVGDWHDPASHAFACLVLAPAKEPSGSATGSARIVLAFNPEARPVDFVIPAGPWHVAIDSSGERASGAQLASGKTLAAGAHALVVLRKGSP